jgi:hypothetical protein
VGDLPPTIEFSGNGQFLQLERGMTDFGAGIAIFIVVEPRPPLISGNGFTRFIDLAFASGSLGDAIVFGRGPSRDADLFFGVFSPTGAASTSVTGGGAVTSDSRQLLEMSIRGTTSETGTIHCTLFKNGVVVGDQPISFAPRAVDRASSFIGRSNLRDVDHPDYHGAMSEILIYNRRLQDDERQLVESYLLERWHIVP